jgi:hypothetical protein
VPVPLLAILAAVAFAELLLNRLFIRLLHPEPLAWDPRWSRLLDGVSLFVFELVSVLSVLVLLAALVRISVWGRDYRAGARLSFPLVGGVTVALGVLGVLFRLPPQLAFHLHLSFLFLGLLVVLTVASSPAAGRFKLGTLLLVVAFALRLLPAMARRFPSLAPLAEAPEALQGAFFLAVAGAAVSYLPRGTSRFAAVLTWIVVCGAALFMRRDSEDAGRIAAYAFDLDLPSTLWGQALALLALGFFLNALVKLLSAPGVARLRGWGLLLIALGGLQLALPYQVALAALGLLCLADAAVRPDGRALSREAFEGLIKEAAAFIGAPRVTITGPAGAEAVRLHAPADRTPLALTLSRRSGAIDDLEIVVGEVPPREPPLTIEHRSAGRLGPRGEGEPVEIGDAAFDGAFRLRDRRDVGARLLDDSTRARLLVLCRGWLGVWPRAGVRYRAREATDLPLLMALLSDLARRAE